MTKSQAIALVRINRDIQATLSKMSPRERAEIEDKWDVEHAYYSSVMAGSKLDRADFEALAKKA